MARLHLLAKENAGTLVETLLALGGEILARAALGYHASYGIVAVEIVFQARRHILSLWNYAHSVGGVANVTSTQAAVVTAMTMSRRCQARSGGSPKCG